MTPLRWLLLALYALLFALGVYYWPQIDTFYDFFIGNSLRFLTAVGAVLVALVTLKLSKAFSAIFAALVISFKVLVGVLLSALLPGVLKAILLPLVFDALSYLHKKSRLLQKWVSGLLAWLKQRYLGSKQWWLAQTLIDRILMALLALLIVPALALVIFYQRFILPYLVNKLGENFVQRGAKYGWGKFRHTLLLDRLFYAIRGLVILSKRRLIRQHRRLKKSLPKR